jgi:hypothetical protein
MTACVCIDTPTLLQGVLALKRDRAVHFIAIALQKLRRGAKGRLFVANLRRILRLLKPVVKAWKARRHLRHLIKVLSNCYM